MAAPHWKADPRHGTYDAIRTQIVQAALRLLITDGRTRLHMGEVAVVSGLSRATIYRYFGDKEELVAAVYVLCVESLAEEFRHAIRRFDDPVEQLVEGLLTMVAYVRGHSTIRSQFAPGALTTRFQNASTLTQGRLTPLPDIDEVPGDRSCCRHGRRHQMRTALKTLSALEIAV